METSLVDGCRVRKKLTVWNSKIIDFGTLVFIVNNLTIDQTFTTLPAFIFDWYATVLFKSTENTNALFKQLGDYCKKIKGCVCIALKCGEHTFYYSSNPEENVYRQQLLSNRNQETTMN